MLPSERAGGVPVCCHFRSSLSLFARHLSALALAVSANSPSHPSQGKGPLWAFFASTSDEIHVLDDDTLPGTEAVELVARRLFQDVSILLEDLKWGRRII